MLLPISETLPASITIPQASVLDFVTVYPSPKSLVSLSDVQLQAQLETDLAGLGSMSIGLVNGGALLNGVQMPDSPLWDVVNPAESWGTSETIAFVEQAITTVNQYYPGTPPLYIGDISDPDGGRLNLHTTHQAGRDVDLGFYYKGGKGTWHQTGNSRNLDLPRNWALMRALIVHTDVQVILLDHRIQKLLYKHARSIGEDDDWLRTIFQYPRGQGKTLVRHAPSHRTHYHVRLYNRRSEEMGRRAYPYLLKAKTIKPPVTYISHRVRSGQTLGHLARRYGTSVRAIRQANGLSNNLIRAGRSYRIPIKDGVSKMPLTIDIPMRRLPPDTPDSLAAINWIPAAFPLNNVGFEDKFASDPTLQGNSMVYDSLPLVHPVFLVTLGTLPLQDLAVLGIQEYLYYAFAGMM